MCRSSFFIGLLLGIAGCTTEAAPCVMGMSVACVCPTGALGAQVCRADHTFDPCECRGMNLPPEGGSNDMAIAGSSDMPPGSNDMAPGSNDMAPLGDLAGPSGPVFLAFGTNVNQLTQNETVTFSAVLTDRAGLDDLAGGILRSPDGSVVYGAFVVGGQKGAYALSLFWSQISQAQSIDFLTSYQTMRTFTAEFFDSHGRSATRDTQLRLYCNNQIACGGSCGVDLLSDRLNCGACGNVCDYRGFCSSGRCNGLQSCVLSSGTDTCNARCALTSQNCTPSSYSLYDSFSFCAVGNTSTTPLACDTVIAAGKYYRCDCRNP
jgi:hypothetical protein